MLIITRRQGERIMLGEDVVIHVLEVSGGSVRIGVEAPRSIPVYREELLDTPERARGEPGAVPTPGR
jgi:carbon storage regulator